MRYPQFAEMLLTRLHELEQDGGGRITVQDFAAYLGISQPLLSTYMKGDTCPSSEKVELLALKLGPGAYDALGLARPDPRLKAITSQWHRIPADKQLKLAEDAARYATEGQEHDERRKLRKPTRSGAHT